MTSSPTPIKADDMESRPHDSSEMLSVGELSRRTGITTAAINYYVRIGVLPPPRKTSKTRALYPAQFENQISRIKELQKMGLNLKGIKQIVNGGPDSPLTAAISGQERAKPGSGSANAGAIPIADFMEMSGLKDDLYDKLVRAGLLRLPRSGPDGLPAHDRRDLSAGRAFATLVTAGVEYPILERHSEYEPLSKAEALFLAEHLSAASKPSLGTQPTILAVAFDAIRRYLRGLQLDKAYPDWRNRKPSS